MTRALWASKINDVVDYANNGDNDDDDDDDTMMNKMKMMEKYVIICLRIASDFINNQFSVFKLLPAFGVFIRKQTSIKLVLTLPTIHR